MKKNFKVSIIIPIYKVEEYLEECIDSVINQTLNFKNNIQMILVNDDSPDNSEKICLKYRDLYPENIVYIKQKNGGVSSARNHGMKYATGEYINFLDSDDKWETTALEKGCTFLDNNKNINLVTFRVKFFDAAKGYHMLDYKFDSNKQIIDIFEDFDCIESHVIATLFRKSVIENFLFDTNLKYGEDIKYLDTVLLNNPKSGLIKESCYLYRKRKNESSATQAGHLKKDYYVALKGNCMSILQQAKEHFNVVPKYFQYSIMYELQWRIKTGIKASLNDEEKKEYIHNIKFLLQNIDDDIIALQRNLSFSYKLLTFKIKYGKKINKMISIDNENLYIGGGRKKVFLGSIKEIVNQVTHFEMDNNKLFVIGNVSFIDEFRLYYSINGKYKEMKTYVMQNVNKDFGVGITRLGYKEFINSKESSDLEFFIEIQGKKYKLINNMTNYSKLNNLKYGYYYENEYLFTLKENRKTIRIRKNPSKFMIWKKESKYLLSLLLKKKMKIVAMRLLYWLTKPFFKKDIYLFCDREFMAEDSGEVLFRYFNQHNDNNKIKTYFIIDKHYPDYKRMKQYGNVVSYHSFKYKLLFLNAKFIISSHADHYINNAFGKSKKIYINLYKFKYIYLTHGILLHDSSRWLNRINKNFALNVVTSPMEYDSIINGPYYFEKSQLIKTGMPRYDNLINLNVPEENKILFMPSWRSTLASTVIPGTQRREYNPLFKESEYYLFYKKLLNDEKLLSVLREKDLKIKFCIHPSFRAQVKDFVGNDCVEFAIDVNSQYETLSSKCIITDYSSAACDFAYLNKPVIYANFDYDHIYEVHYYNKGYFDYDKHGFGPNCRNYEETLDAILKIIESDFKVEKKYEKRMKNFFFYRDNKNAQRVYKELMKLSKKDEKKQQL